ncbi:MAG: SusC/RagA family TonB-linked outer membrane protein [Gemmatimonadota bacterium]
MRRKLVLLVALILAFAVPDAVAQQRAVTGTVTDASTGAPVASPHVSVETTGIGTVGNSEGRFVLAGVPDDRDVTLVVDRIGYKDARVILPAGERAIQIQLEADLLQLEDLLVTGLTTSIRRRNLANSVASVSGEELNGAPVATLENALQGKVAGAVISSNSGAPGGGTQVQLRGVSTINVTAEPLYVVDGVIVSNVAIASNQNALTASTGGSNPALTQDGQVNRIADINPEDIESIDILKGASASAIYGSKASNGVVIITTKRGSVGAPRIKISARGGFFDLSNKLGFRPFSSQADAISVFGATVGNEFQAGRVFDHEQDLAGRNDASFDFSANVSGGSENTRYFASGIWKDDAGIIDNTGFEKRSLRINLQQTLGSRADLSVSTNVINTKAQRGLTNNDNAQTSYYMVFANTPSFLPLTDASGEFIPNLATGNGSNPLQTASLLDNNEDVWRFIGSANVDIRLKETDNTRLTFRADGGVDFFTQENALFAPPELFFEPSDGLIGTSLLSRSNNLNTTVNAGLVLATSPGGGSSQSTTSLGVQFSRTDLDISRIVSENLVAGQPNVNSGTQIGIVQNRLEVKDFGIYLQEEFLTMDERLLLTASVRLDQSSANGDDEELFVFPKGSVSYRFANLSQGLVNEVKLRAAFGRTGNKPLFGQKFTALNGTTNIGGLPGLVVGGVAGDPDIEPEKTTEIEAGIDATVFNNRGQLELTVYQQNISDLLLNRTLAPSTGFVTQIFNGGKLRARGLEAALSVTPVATSGFTWSSRTTFALNRTKITELPVPTFLTGGFGAVLGAFQIEEGASATQIVGTDLDASGNGIIRKMGDGTPDYTMGFSNDLSFGRLNIGSLFDWRKGSAIVNLTTLLYDFAQNTADFEAPGGRDPVDIPDCFPDDCFGADRLNGFGTFAQQLIESGSFLKLRELSVSYDFPEAAFSSIFGSNSSVRLTFSGRNLITVTDYTGLDPEVSNFGNQPIARNIDVAPFPPSRSYWLTFDVSF